MSFTDSEADAHDDNIYKNQGGGEGGNNPTYSNAQRNPAQFVNSS